METEEEYIHRVPTEEEYVRDQARRTWIWSRCLTEAEDLDSYLEYVNSCDTLPIFIHNRMTHQILEIKMRVTVTRQNLLYIVL